MALAEAAISGAAEMIGVGDSGGSAIRYPAIRRNRSEIDRRGRPPIEVAGTFEAAT